MRIKRISNENGNRYRRVKRVLFGDHTGRIRTFAIISADNPIGMFSEDEQTKLSKADAIKRDGNKALGYGGFDYVKIKGKYIDHNLTYIIFNLTQQDAECVARCFGQESYFFGRVSIDPNIEPSTIAYYKTTNGCKSYRLIEITRTVTDETEAQDFFSKYGLKFRINLQEFGYAVTPVKNQVMFEETFTKPTFMARGRARRWARE